MAIEGSTRNLEQHRGMRIFASGYFLWLLANYATRNSSEHELEFYRSWVRSHFQYGVLPPTGEKWIYGAGGRSEISWL